MLTLIGVAAIGWLAATGRLGLYIHPRYFVFTVVMAALATVAAVLAAAFLPTVREDDDGHDHGEAPRSPRARRWALGASAALVALTTAALVVLPPTTLTTTTVEQRDLNASAALNAEAPDLVAGDGAGFGVKDWAGLLRQGADADFLADAAPDITGFVTPAPDDPDVFYVARFLVTCCAVDAQPLGVPVRLPGWDEEYPVDGWVRVTGSFVHNPSPTSMLPVVLAPASVERIEQPADPYVY